jgi:tRNA G37 N-methylase Trm5
MHGQGPHRRLQDAVSILLEQHRAPVHLLDELPKRWERFADVALLPQSAFTQDEWSGVPKEELWQAVAEALDVERVGRIGEIVGERRESTVELLLGEDDWVVRRENGVDYGYHFTKCMFSAGNVNERRRMGEVGLAGETVIDLFCGIGYYTLSMLVHSEVAQVHCCEWNPKAVEALKWSLQKNGVGDRCTVHEGDNRVTAPHLSGRADRVILGLLPTAEGGFDLAINCLNNGGGFLHIHGVAPASDHQSWVDEIITKLSNIKHDFSISETSRVRVKSYAPHWDHLVLDLHFIPRA